MVLTETVCSECGLVNQDRPNYCPDCGSEDPWVEEELYEFDNEDLPIVFETSLTDDFWGLWDDFCRSYFGTTGLEGEDIKGLPEGFPRMKYRMIDVYWVLTEELEVEGPYLSRKEAREEHA